MIISADEAKAWLREDSDDPQVLNQINLLIGAAETYLKNATGLYFDSENSLAKLFCLVLCADWYENRDLIGSQPSEKVRLTIQSMMAQLQNNYKPPAAPTGLEATAGSGTVDLTWDANAEENIAGYRVYQDGVMITAAVVVGTTYQVTGLSSGVSYRFQVTAVDRPGNESEKSCTVSTVVV